MVSFQCAILILIHDPSSLSNSTNFSIFLEIYLLSSLLPSFLSWVINYCSLPSQFARTRSEHKRSLIHDWLVWPKKWFLINRPLILLRKKKCRMHSMLLLNFLGFLLFFKWSFFFIFNYLFFFKNFYLYFFLLVISFSFSLLSLPFFSFSSFLIAHGPTFFFLRLPVPTSASRPHRQTHGPCPALF